MDISLGDVAKKVGRFRQAALDAGRDEMPITIVAFGDPSIETLSHYRDLGVERVIVGAARQGWDDPASTIPFLDRYAEVIPELKKAAAAGG
jgi:hypothetical protein